MQVRELQPADWAAVRAIFEDGIRSGDATFETEAPEWEAWDAGHLPLRLVAERDGEVAGWGALSPVSDRCVYQGVAEVSVYVAKSARIWTLQAGVFPENEASLRLHRACGFRDVGVRERLGEIGGVWRDVLLLERRSTLVGT
jgi:L-amino acid N-acyltransferase YncA